jgi:alkylresorcinol/alkylpyrone synthase
MLSGSNCIICVALPGGARRDRRSPDRWLVNEVEAARLRGEGSEPRLLALTTAVPPHVLRQEQAKALARRIFAGRGGELERLLPVFDHAGIDTRHSCLPPERHLEPQGWKARNRSYVDHALDLIGTASRAALERAGCGAADVGAVVVVSTTGLATPSLDALLIERLALPRDTVRLPIFGLGCVGGVLGLARAAALARQMPDRPVLLAVVELCALTFRAADTSNSNIVAAALFGDGAAAAVVAAGGAGPVIAEAGEHTWAGSLDVMGWRIEDDGFGVLFSRDIPALIRTRYRGALAGFLGKCGLGLDDIDGFAMHPGGAKVLQALEETLELAPAALADSRAVLRTHGNMSAPTVLFVLERMLARGTSGRLLASALGPGFTAGFLLLET